MSIEWHLSQEDCWVCGFSERLHKEGIAQVVIDSDTFQGSFTICVDCIPMLREKLTKAKRNYRRSKKP